MSGETLPHSDCKHGDCKKGSEACTLPLRQVIHSADICVLYQQPNLAYVWAENLPLPLRRHWRAGCRDSDMFSAGIAEQMTAIKQQILSGKLPSGKLEICLPQTIANAAAVNPHEPGEIASLRAEIAGSVRHDTCLPPHFTLPNRFISESSAGNEQNLWLQFSFEPHYNTQGEVLGLVSTAVNISALRAREDILQILLREVSHRSKNLLAVIQSIAVQTARYCSDTPQFLKQFQGRLHSLAASQDLITDSDWHGAPLRDLILAQTHFYTDKQQNGSACAFSISGENPYIFPTAAVYIGLALHELVFNSVSFGVLAQGRGKIAVRCHAASASHAEHIGNKSGETEAERKGEANNTAKFTLIWSEQFGRRAAVRVGEENFASLETKAKAAELHFGRLMLEKIVPAAVSGSAKYTIKNNKLEYILNIPVSQIRDSK